jgi:GIY-YIG catalytic domain
MKMFIYLIFLSYIFFCVIKDIKNSFLFYNTLNNVDLIIAGIIPLKTYKNLSFPDKFKSELHRVGGVYGLINTYDSKKIKQYIGYSKDLYQRLMDHLKGREF